MEQQEGKTVVTIRDVAQRAGVAVSTASRALSGGSASEATRPEGSGGCRGTAFRAESCGEASDRWA